MLSICDPCRPTARRCACLPLLLVLAAAACGRPASVAEQRQRLAVEGTGEVTVAAAWPWEAREGMLYGEGLELAVAEVNESGGVQGRPLEILRVDDQESVNEGRLTAQRLAENPEVLAIIGHLQSYITVPAASIYDAAGLVLLAPATTSAELTSKGYSRVFRATVTDDVIGRQMAEYAVAAGYRRVAVYYERSIYGRALANAFEEELTALQASVVSRDSYDIDLRPQADLLEPMLARWRSLQLDAVFLAGQPPVAGELIELFRRVELDLPVIGGDAMSSPHLVQAHGEAAEGVVVGSFFHPDEPRQEVETFVAAFRRRFGVLPDASSALGYDAVKVLAGAMNEAESLAPDDVAQALHRMNGWMGVTGPFAFDEKGDLIGRKLVKLVVRDGRFEYLGDASPAAATASLTH